MKSDVNVDTSAPSIIDLLLLSVQLKITLFLLCLSLITSCFISVLCLSTNLSLICLCVSLRCNLLITWLSDWSSSIPCDNSAEWDWPIFSGSGLGFELLGSTNGLFPSLNPDEFWNNHFIYVTWCNVILDIIVMHTKPQIITTLINAL